MMKSLLHFVFWVFMLGLVSCASDNKNTDEIEEETTEETAKINNNTQSVSKEEERATYLSMTDEQYDDFFRNTRLGINDAISSNKGRIEKLQDEIAELKKKGDTESKSYTRAQNLLKNAQSRSVKLDARLRNFDAKIKTFKDVIREDRPAFIDELKEILKS